MYTKKGAYMQKETAYVQKETYYTKRGETYKNEIQIAFFE